MSGIYLYGLPANFGQHFFTPTKKMVRIASNKRVGRIYFIEKTPPSNKLKRNII